MKDCLISAMEFSVLVRYFFTLKSLPYAWWRHQMEIFSALLAILAGNSPVPGEFPTQRPVTRSFDVFFDLHLNKQLSKQSWGWWFEMLSRPLWGHCNGMHWLHMSETPKPIWETGLSWYYSYPFWARAHYTQEFSFTIQILSKGYLAINRWVWARKT